ncbi:putative nuclease HARBI1 [Anthonomus grandis grandis]|uniref:putative nuclease HARBI1 n=1 Tax=Anthonomus grandis grandis TaxID=2921223 RepID=UPI002164F1EE|nr:putative nuclease HARBI1 [Anthonomus grandis grandis]
MAEFILNLRSTKYYKPRRRTCDRDFKVLYRFTREHVEWISNHFLGTESGERRGGAINNIDKMKIFLRYVGDPGFQSGVGEDVGVHQSSVSKVVTEVTEKLIEKCGLWIKFPHTAADIIEAKQKWQSNYSFPCALGVIDCTHIKIKKPPIYSDEYINRKGYHSINVQATCNSDEWFTSVDASWPGSVHDSRISSNSKISNIARNDFHRSQALLLGDEGYGIAPWLMVPFRNPNTPQERAHNNLFTKERVIIERCFGQLKQRFPMLQYKVRVSIEKVPKFVICCCILHNVAKYLKDELDPMELPLEDIPLAYPAEEELDNNNIRRSGQRRRSELADVILALA